MANKDLKILIEEGKILNKIYTIRREKSDVRSRFGSIVWSRDKAIEKAGET